MNQITHNQQLYTNTSYKVARLTTKRFSNSFYMACRLIDLPLRLHIFAVYALVRTADEIVDSWRTLDMANQLDNLEAEVFAAIKLGYSTNMVVHAFARTVQQYHLDHIFIKAFFKSMRMDVQPVKYSGKDYQQYIYGSSQAVGLMCLAIFCEGDSRTIKQLRPAAEALGAAFQKINFLRDIKSDHIDLNRSYFPDVDVKHLSELELKALFADIDADLLVAGAGLAQLPASSRYGVALATRSYGCLFYKLRKLSPDQLLSSRVSVSKMVKLLLWLEQYLRKSFHI